ncbi:MAG TPA: ATP-binding protein [Tepidisphaeraceae bacterium]|nr:ATP-binding protein [Tepidisphaeraceae bacterium]
MTRIARGRVSLHAKVVNAHELIRRSLQLVQKEIEETGLDLLLSLRAKRHELWADPTRLQQVLANLLQNAVKFTPEGGNIPVRTSNDGDTLNIVVMDTGIGIEQEVLPRLFVPFERGERTVTRKYGGLGLGLSIRKSIVEMHNGALTAASEGTGAAASVAEAIEIAEREEIDLLVSDLGLPDGTGHDVMRHLKSRGIKGIALSGFGQQEDVTRSTAAGFEAPWLNP